MKFNQGQIICSTQPERCGPTRWHVLDSQVAGNVNMVKLCDNSVQDPLWREFVGATPDLSRKGRDPFVSLDLKNQFEEACLCASSNISGLPEPIDYFTIEIAEKDISPEIAGNMPFMVFYYGDVNPVYPLDPQRIGNGNHFFSMVRKIAYSVGFTMRALNKNNMAMRQVTLRNLRYLRSINSFIIAEFFGLCRFNMNAQQYDPHNPHLVLNMLYAAPECFSTAVLTPATDVYALAIVLLQYMGARIDKPICQESQVLGHLEEIEKRFRFPLPESMVRALKIALQEEPRKRMREFGEFITMFNGKEVKKFNNPGNRNKNVKKAGQKPWNRKF